MQLKVQEVHEKGDSYPLILNFQNGWIGDNFKFTDSAILGDKNGKKTAAAEVDSMLYIGCETVEEIGSTFILARNRLTGKVRLIEAGVADLKLHKEPKKVRENELDNSALELSRKFGSKKNKSIMEQREKLKVTTDTIQTQMKTLTENISEEQVDVMPYMQQSSEQFYIPPINKEAKTASEIYDPLEILNESEFDQINSEIESSSQPIEYCMLLKSIVANRKLTPQEQVLALYANSLFRLFSLTSNDICKKALIICEQSAKLNDIILKKFTLTPVKQSSRPRNRPATYKDKTLCYAVVISLLLNNFKLQVSDLISITKSSVVTLLKKLKATYAVPVCTTGKDKLIQLKLPLPNLNVQTKRKSAAF